MYSSAIKQQVSPGLTEFNTMDLTLLQPLIENHRNLYFFSITEDIFLFQRFTVQRIKQFTRKKLLQQYHTDKPINESRLVFLGDGRSGKTSTIKTICYFPFSGRERSTALLDLKYVFKINDFSKVSRYQQLMERVENAFYSEDYNSPTHTDQVERFHFSFESELIEDLSNSKFFIKNLSIVNKTSERSSTVQVYDFGGQTCFYALHTLFMSSFSAFVVVFDTSRFSCKNVEAFKFWCESVIAHAPTAPVLFVGTHWRRCLQKLGTLAYSNITNTINSVIENLNVEIIHRSKFRIINGYGSAEKYTNLFYPLENSEGPQASGALRIRNAIRNMYHGASGLFSQCLAVKFATIVFMNYLQLEFTHLSFGDFHSKCKDSGFQSEDIGEMLYIFKKIGLIMHFKNIPGLDEKSGFVILSISWLGKALSTIINDPNLHRQNLKVSIGNFNAYMHLIGTGILSQVLFEDLLKRYSSEEKHFFLALCLHFSILVRHANSTSMVQKYWVPRLLPAHSLSNDGISIILPRQFDFFLVSSRYISLELFTTVCSSFIKIIESGDTPEESVLCSSFCRIIVSQEVQVSVVFFEAKRKIGFKTHGPFDAHRLLKLCHILILRLSPIDLQVHIEDSLAKAAE
eukprot:snap_masked-scaffold_40-processed-gene-0.25-mRNA-1 protein AED:1.00 eAED:1.00 QI:0/0/0/0/1/1/2/0/627